MIEDETQYGAVKNSNTTCALLAALHPIFEGLDDGKHFARILLVDFSKAFDHIDHETVLQKLTANGVDEFLVRWFRGFLTERKQRVVIEQLQSEWRQINGGVPQGTLSGPQLFVNMVSDLKTLLPTIKYVDDTTIVEVVTHNSPSLLQTALNTIVSWSRTNKLYLNAAKTKELRIDFRRAPPPLDPLTIDGTDIEVVSSAKLLGVTISCDLKWELHISNIHAKASSPPPTETGWIIPKTITSSIPDINMPSHRICMSSVVIKHYSEGLKFVRIHSEKSWENNCTKQ